MPRVHRKALGVADGGPGSGTPRRQGQPVGQNRAPGPREVDSEGVEEGLRLRKRRRRYGIPDQRCYCASGSKEHVSMEHGACERRAPKQIKIGNPYSQICFPNFVEEEEEKSPKRTYYRVTYGRGLYGNLILLGKQK